VVDDNVMVSMLASSVVDHHVMVSILASSVVDGRVMFSMLASSVVDDHVMVSMLATSKMLDIFSSFIIKSSIYAVFCFVSLRDRIFILFLLMTWPDIQNFCVNTFEILPLCFPC
jgi:hypothetical protein